MVLLGVRDCCRTQRCGGPRRLVYFAIVCFLGIATPVLTVFYLSSIQPTAFESVTAANRSNVFLVEKGNFSRTFEKQYVHTYQRTILYKNVKHQQLPARFVLFRMGQHANVGIGNRIRSLSGAIFVAAMTDRIFLMDSDMISTLFSPPIVDGVVLDWSPSIAGGACDDPATSVTLPQWKPLPNFAAEYDNFTCIIVASTHGHDRMLAGYNDVIYRQIILERFGSLSRLNWTRRILGMFLQRPKKPVLDRLSATMERLGLSQSAPEVWIALQFRTFSLDYGENYTDDGYVKKYFDCAIHLVQEILRDNRRDAVIFFSTDAPSMRDVARRALTILGNHSSKISLVTLEGARVDHVGQSEFKQQISPYDSFMDWFCISECDTVVATGTSSFAMSAFFRPPSFSPPSPINDPPKTMKTLYTIDGIGKKNGLNPKCGAIQANDYHDFNFGIGDPKYISSLAPP